MYVACVNVFVKPEFVEPFKAAILDNASNTRKEPGNIRFDVCQGDEDPTRFVLYEVYRTKEDFARHQETVHYLRWKNAVTDWMAQPRQSGKFRPIFFGEERV
jgi:autoinducer 2-degrading protein